MNQALSPFRRIWDALRGIWVKRPTLTVLSYDEKSDVRYVVVDLEWNQYPKWVRTPVSRDGIVMPHEIIQIGAVKVDGAFRVVDTFTAAVRLQGRRKLSKHVARVIQKTQAEIDQGDDFPVAYARFSQWSADAERFITWGTDDLRVFQNNLAYYKMSELDASCWYDAQMIYARQVRGDRVQTALATAATVLDVDDSGLAHHDALDDAYITVGICGGLDMEKGMSDLEKPPSKPKRQRNESRLFLQKKFVSAGSEGGFETRMQAKQHCSALPVCCPTCGNMMKMESRRVANGDRWMKMGGCKEHGKHLVRYRVRRKSDGEFVWTRTVYAPDEELEQYFREKAARSGSGSGRGGRRHHGHKKPVPGPQPQTTTAGAQG
ncbi:MAG: exonuclease domain-containing protein [Firmicutes bacterium]|nr:exonuclease domain-containing protein [Bacillota bacterium]